MKDVNWSYINNFLRENTDNLKDILDKESIESIRHYLAHDEYEMAFEIMYIEVMKHHNPPKLNYKESLEVGLELGLDQESVFDEEFWPKFVNYISRVTR